MRLPVCAWLLSFALFAAHAHARDLDLVWRAPAQGCPDRAALLQALQQRLQREVTSGSDADVHITADVAYEQAGYVLSLRTASNQGIERRELRAVACNELAQATVLITALLITDQPGLPPSAAETEQPQQASWYLRAQLVGDLGTFPVATLGPSVMGGVGFGRWRIELGGAHMFDQALHVSGSTAPVGRMQLTTAAATVCYGLMTRPFVAPCLLGELGRLAVSGDNLLDRQDRTLLWAMAGAGARASLELLGWLRWHAELAAGLPWDRAQFGVQELGSVHRVASLIARVSTGVEGVF